MCKSCLPELRIVYVLEINMREETSRLFFETEMAVTPLNDLDWELDNDIGNLDRAFSLSVNQTGGNQTQMQLLLLEEENTRMAEQRENEIRHIVKSIVDLNDIFKDLSHMVADQVRSSVVDPFIIVFSLTGLHF